MTTARLKIIRIRQGDPNATDAKLFQMPVHLRRGRNAARVADDNIRAMLLNQSLHHIIFHPVEVTDTLNKWVGLLCV